MRTSELWEKLMGFMNLSILLNPKTIILNNKEEVIFRSKDKRDIPVYI